MVRRIHTRFGSAIIIGLLLALSACGGASPAANPVPTVDQAALIQVRLKSFAIELSTNTVKAGVNYKFFGPSGVVVAKN